MSLENNSTYLCPECGGHPALLYQPGESYFVCSIPMIYSDYRVSCPNPGCNLYMRSPSKPTLSEAFEAWERTVLAPKWVNLPDGSVKTEWKISQLIRVKLGGKVK